MTVLLRPFTRETLGTIRKNAGKMPKDELARSVGVTVSFLERVAREQNIDLSPVVEHVPDQREPSGTKIEPRPSRRQPQPRNHHTEYVSAAFRASDVDLMDRLASEHRIRRSRVITRVFENARARGLLADLASVPAPLPDKTGEFDEL
jgi:hypothetical protein